MLEVYNFENSSNFVKMVVERVRERGYATKNEQEVILWAIKWEEFKTCGNQSL